MNTQTSTFDAFLNAITKFESKWQISHYSGLLDREDVITEEVNEVFRALKSPNSYKSEDEYLEHIKEELGDVLGAVFGTIIWCNNNISSSITLNEVLQIQTKKLNTRSKYGYSLKNIVEDSYKVTHAQKVVNLLEKDRDLWEVLDGPYPCHPEVYELLTLEEKQRLENKKGPSSLLEPEVKELKNITKE